MISVLADGSTIYPSALLEPTPRYDTGMFFDTAADPLRKDVLEMLLRLFDREELQLIPALEFAAPLPALEAAPPRRAGADGIEWIGPEGTAWTQNFTPRRGLAPYYNTLDPRVQEAMLDVVRELAQRYAQHRVLRRPGPAALGLRLCPVAGTGMGHGRRHDRPLRARHRRAACPAAGRDALPPAPPSSPATSHRGPWLQWRAESCTASTAGSARRWRPIAPAARLYLAGAEMLCGAGNPGRAAPRLAPQRHAGRGPAARGHRSAALPGRPGHRAAAAGTDRPRRATQCPGGRPGNRPDARRRRLLPRPALPGQPVLPSAAGGPHPLVRSEKPVPRR